MKFRILLFILASAWVTPALPQEQPLSSQPKVKAFIDEMSEKHHFEKKNLITLFDNVHLRPTVMQNIQQPLEKKPWYLYRLLFVTDKRVKNGIHFWKKNQEVLNKASKRYGVPPGIIVATIGIESKYGEDVGHYRVIDALASVAFSNSPRAPFFRRELAEYLLLTREQHVDPLSLKGSYAGAMGLAQFMPDSYRRYAVRYSGHGHPDLYHSDSDVIFSIANYYHTHGWVEHQPIAVRAPASGFQQKKITAQGKKPPRTVTLENYFTRDYWLAYHNFEVIKKYNASDLYAMAVLNLSQKITERKRKSDEA